MNYFNFTTGPATLPDVGELSYNGCKFSPLFVSKVSGTIVKDVAGRATKYMQYMIEVDGYVTAPEPAVLDGIAPTMLKLRRLLTAQCGQLTYTGRGFDIEVNQRLLRVGGKVRFDSSLQDVAWGPVPELIEFQPLGDTNSAKVMWKVTVNLVEIQDGSRLSDPLLQFNFETSLNYADNGYSSMSVKGTMEIPQNRIPGSRTALDTVDDRRTELENRLFSSTDLRRFHVTRREFSVTRDKRTMEFDYALEEKPFMDLPPNSMVATGSFNARPKTSGLGLVNWLCTLRATYTVPLGIPRRVAWFAFLGLLRERMRRTVHAGYPSPPYPPASPTAPVDYWAALLNAQTAAMATDRGGVKPILTYFSLDEGLYLDSKTSSFSATWWLVSYLQNLLVRSGIWRRLPEEDRNHNNVWAASVRSISGMQSWLANKLDPELDVIVDFGGG